MKPKSKTKVHELTDLCDGWDICRESGKPIKGKHDDRVYWFYPSGMLRMVKRESRP